MAVPWRCLSAVAVGAVAAEVPAGRHPMPVRRAVAALLFRLIGWRKVGTLPRTGIFIGAPHTSNWDFVLTLMVLWTDGIPPRLLVKREAFWWPLGPVLRALGGIPTDRSGRSGLVERLVAEAQADRSFALVIAPDGTRHKTDHWKSGFYRLALSTGLTVTLGFLDGPTRTAGVGPTIHVTGDMRADMDRIRPFYADKHGVRPGHGSTPRLLGEDDAPGSGAPGEDTGSGRR